MADFSIIAGDARDIARWAGHYQATCHITGIGRGYAPRAQLTAAARSFHLVMSDALANISLARASARAIEFTT